MSRTRLSPEARTEQLLDAAAELVIEHGPSGLNMQSVADHVGVSKPLVYNYFANRDELILELFERVRSQWSTTAPRPSPEDAVAGRDPREVYDELLHAYTDWFFDHSSGAGQLFAQLMSEPILEERSGALRRQLRSDNVAWWARMTELLGVPSDQALAYSAIFNAGSEAAWELLTKGRAAREAVEEVFYTSAHASLDALIDAHSD